MTGIGTASRMTSVGTASELTVIILLRTETDRNR